MTCNSNITTCVSDWLVSNHFELCLPQGTAFK